VRTTVESPLELTFQRPNRLLMEAGQYGIACNGGTLVSVAPELRQYTMIKAPAQLEKKHLQFGSIMGGADEGPSAEIRPPHPLAVKTTVWGKESSCA
jgi:hypothetical protein